MSLESVEVSDAPSKSSGISDNLSLNNSADHASSSSSSSFGFCSSSSTNVESAFLSTPSLLNTSNIATSSPSTSSPGCTPSTASSSFIASATTCIC
eukprot:CAMPEP_0169254392 /NCGR_PEP_ID=MMETSP1016-20121227/39150_1 /TAXON_ID=342587 /ORGANISM="Karlodinium micrum, Strain CCMP2283" /LENGTH=95 /DNA_ID=CAMNT_0009335849 /DNA_START=106 /DNA_END=393 /DNA_ORIENTATION=+